MINAYRVRGHLIADLDPLGAEPQLPRRARPGNLRADHLGSRPRVPHRHLGEAIGEGGPKPVATLREILETLRQTYCGKIGCEYMNIQVPEQKRWLQHRMEPEANQLAARPAKRACAFCSNLIAAEEFEHFLHSRFVGQKRFALEGGETALAILDEMLERAADNNVHEVVIGMAHRGRLNMLANVVGKDLKQIFSEFEGEIDPASTQGSGDVKYHLGATGVRALTEGGKRDRGLGLAQPQPSGGRRSGGGRHRAAQAGPPGRYAPRARDPAADPRRRGFRRTRRGGRDAEPFAARRLFHRRHHPPGHQQPDRLHHAAR